MIKLLIVDDNEQNLYMLETLLKGSGYEVDTASDGSEALEKARRHPPDMIISDILMPVMDGFTLIRKWKKDEQLKQVPFIVYTATYTDPKDEKFALGLGADRFIKKPAEPDDLLRAAQEVLTEKEAHRLVPAEPAIIEESDQLKQYSERLVKKLEDKMLQLEKANETLEKQISERKHAEGERDRLFNFSLDLLSVAGFDGYFKQINPAWEKTLGWTTEELLGRPWLDFVHPEDRQATIQAGNQLTSGQTVIRFKNRCRCKDGSYRWLSWNGFPQVHENTIFSVTRDITEQKKAEDEIRRLNEALEQRVKKRTAELEKKSVELERFNKLFVDRELRMVELKKEIAELKMNRG